MTDSIDNAINTNTGVTIPPIPHAQGREYCDEHKMAMNQLNTLSTLPTAVSRMTGIVSLIAITFLGIAGLALNAHFEARRTTTMYNEKLDSLSLQITDVEKASISSEARINERLIRMEGTLDQLQLQLANHDNSR